MYFNYNYNYILFLDLSDTLISFYRWRYFILTKNSECEYVIYLNSYYLLLELK